MEENNGSEMGRGLVVCSMGTVTGQIPTEVKGQLDFGTVHGLRLGSLLLRGDVTTLHGQVLSSPAPLHAQALSTKNVLHGQDLSSPIQLHGCGEGHVTHNDEQGGTGESQFIFVAGGSGTPTASSLSDQVGIGGLTEIPLGKQRRDKGKGKVS
ncbi:hypothetical protein ACOSP7_007432 [Xanthoceras sorbifolium]